MRALPRPLALALAVVTAAAGLALPASAAQAARQYICPRVYGVCTFTEPGGHGQLRILFDEEEVILPPARSAVNQTGDPWCFYAVPGFQGPQREVGTGETVADFGFPAHSARPGPCF